MKLSQIPQMVTPNLRGQGTSEALDDDFGSLMWPLKSLLDYLLPPVLAS